MSRHGKLGNISADYKSAVDTFELVNLAADPAAAAATGESWLQSPWIIPTAAVS